MDEEAWLLNDTRASCCPSGCRCCSSYRRCTAAAAAAGGGGSGGGARGAIRYGFKAF